MPILPLKKRPTAMALSRTVLLLFRMLGGRVLIS